MRGTDARNPWESRTKNGNISGKIDRHPRRDPRVAEGTGGFDVIDGNGNDTYSRRFFNGPQEEFALSGYAIACR